MSRSHRHWLIICKTAPSIRVINYEKIYGFLTEALPKLGHVNLLENVAERIITFASKNPRIENGARPPCQTGCIQRQDSCRQSSYRH